MRFVFQNDRHILHALAEYGRLTWRSWSPSTKGCPFSTVQSTPYREHSNSTENQASKCTQPSFSSRSWPPQPQPHPQRQNQPSKSRPSKSNKSHLNLQTATTPRQKANAQQQIKPHPTSPSPSRITTSRAKPSRLLLLG